MLGMIGDDDGIVLRRDAVEAGYDDKWLRRATDAGVLVRLRQGAYAIASVWEPSTRAERHLLLAKAVRQLYADDVALSHTSAHLLTGGPDWGLDLRSAHLTHLEEKRSRRLAKVIHHHGLVLADDVTRDAGGWITSPTRTALDTASLAPRDPAVAVLDWTLNQGLTTLEEIGTMVNRMTHWPDTLPLQVAIRLVDPASESVAETRARLMFMDQHLPRPQSQFEVFHPSGRLAGRVDFAWPDHKVLCEIDGMGKYLSNRRPGESVADAVIREKLREDLLRELTGWVMIRLTWADLEHPYECAKRLRRLLGIAAA